MPTKSKVEASIKQKKASEASAKETKANLMLALNKATDLKTFFKDHEEKLLQRPNSSISHSSYKRIILILGRFIKHIHRDKKTATQWKRIAKHLRLFLSRMRTVAKNPQFQIFLPLEAKALVMVLKST